THGMTNGDVPGTDPPTGGSPDGGIWANVQLRDVRPKGPQTARAALKLVTPLVSGSTTACRITSAKVSVKGWPGRRTAVAPVPLSGRRVPAPWSSVQAMLTPTNRLAAEIGKGCL